MPSMVNVYYDFSRNIQDISFYILLGIGIYTNLTPMSRHRPDEKPINIKHLIKSESQFPHMPHPYADLNMQTRSHPGNRNKRTNQPHDPRETFCKEASALNLIPGA
jgi:hypothetical protein